MANNTQVIENLLRETVGVLKEGGGTSAIEKELESGKTNIASAISSKGIETSPDDSLDTMADNISSIQQVTTEIDGGEMYAAQLFGDGALWNLYEVLKDCKNTFLNAAYGHDGNTYNYKALIVCEYYKGYDSIQLKGADAYYTCDGNFYASSQPLHAWHDSDNGKANRWVCFLWATETPTFEVGVNDTAISPRSIYVGGHIGTIAYNANGRLTELVCGVEDTDVVDNFLPGSYTQEFGFNIMLRNVKNIQFNTWAKSNKGTLSVTGVEVLDFKAAGQSFYEAKFSIFHSDCDRIIYGSDSMCFSKCSNLVGILLNNAIELGDEEGYGEFIGNSSSNLKFIYAPALQRCKNLILNSSLALELNDMTVGAMVTNLKMHKWNPTNVLVDATKKAQLIENIKNHILARVSDNSESQTPLIFTVSTNMANAIGSENIEWQGETMTLSAAFATKGWTLAGV